MDEWRVASRGPRVAGGGWRVVWAAGVVLFAFLLATSWARAHGGGTPQLANEPAGPYLLSVWSEPNPAVVGKLHLTLALADPESGAPVTEANVTLAARQGETTLTAAASHEGALVPEFYEADLALPREGEWQFQIDISGDAGSGQAGFALAVVAGTTNWLLIALVGVGVAVVGWVGVLLWRGRGGGRGRKKAL